MRLKNQTYICIKFLLLCLCFLSNQAQSGLPSHIESAEKVIIVDPSAMTWGAYQAGELIRSGPASSGSDWCSDLQSTCHSPEGTFRIYSKGGPDCISHTFPLPDGGARMPYCMYFDGPYALHGSYDMHSYNASHGCIRLNVSAARWLSQEFANVGTKVIIKSYGYSRRSRQSYDQIDENDNSDDSGAAAVDSNNVMEYEQDEPNDNSAATTTDSNDGIDYEQAE